MRRRLSAALVWLAPALALFAPTSAAAHPAQVAHARIAVEELTVEIALSMNLFELDLVLTLDRDLDGAVSPAELEARRADVGDYLREKASVTTSGRALPMELRALGIGRRGDGRAVADATLAFPAEQPLRDVTIRCEPLTELGADHTTLARIDTGGEIRQFVFRQGVTYEQKAGTLVLALKFLTLGVVHIFIGYDHIAFLVGLLLAGGSTLSIVKIVTTFTIAHSVTLSLAALDVVTLSPAFVEAGIALSIVYVAAENLFLRRPPRGRWLVSFGFGLVHGFGFAGVLKELALPSSSLAWPLLTFNLGVEIAQVAIVAVVAPALYALTRTRLHAPLTHLASVVILSLGLFWLYQRVLA
jgi:hydrogenase/urease accessory protein HupE